MWKELFLSINADNMKENVYEAIHTYYFLAHSVLGLVGHPNHCGSFKSVGTLSSPSYQYSDLVGLGWYKSLHFISNSAECDADFQGEWGNAWGSPGLASSDSHSYVKVGDQT